MSQKNANGVKTFPVNYLVVSRNALGSMKNRLSANIAITDR